jgi:hypothetical protein
VHRFRAKANDAGTRLTVMSSPDIFVSSKEKIFQQKSGKSIFHTVAEGLAANIQILPIRHFSRRIFC